MWKCEKCDREFKNPDQHHYCGKIDTIDAYIADQSEEIRPLLQKIRETIHASAPEAIEKFYWQMPTFWQETTASKGENIIHFAAFKNHIGIYPGDLSEAPFIDRLKEYKHSKGAIQFPNGKSIDFDLITDIISWRVNSIIERIVEKDTSEIDAYIAALPDYRRDKISEIIVFMRDRYPSLIGVCDFSPKTKFPVFKTQNGQNYVGIASQKQYIAIHFGRRQCPDIIAKADNKIKTGVGCAKIPDSVTFPIDHIKQAIETCFVAES